MSEPTVDLGQQIRRARERRGWTQQRLALEIGVGARTIGGWERGESVPMNRMGKLEEVLGIGQRMEPNGAEPAADLAAVDLSQLSMDVAEACADALLIAVGQALVCRGVMPTVPLVRGAALAAMDEVLQRTMNEGPKPR